MNLICCIQAYHVCDAPFTFVHFVLFILFSAPWTVACWPRYPLFCRVLISHMRLTCSLEYQYASFNWEKCISGGQKSQYCHYVSRAGTKKEVKNGTRTLQDAGAEKGEVETGDACLSACTPSWPAVCLADAVHIFKFLFVTICWFEKINATLSSLRRLRCVILSNTYSQTDTVWIGVR